MTFSPVSFPLLDAPPGPPPVSFLPSFLLLRLCDCDAKPAARLRHRPIERYAYWGRGRERETPGLFRYDHCRDSVRKKSDNQSPEQIRWPCDLRVAWIELELTETTFHAWTKRMIKITGGQHAHAWTTHLRQLCGSAVWPMFREDLHRNRSKAHLGPACAPTWPSFFFPLLSPMLIANLLRVTDDARCDPRDSALDLRRFLAKLRPRRRLGETEAYRRDTRPC